MFKKISENKINSLKQHEDENSGEAHFLYRKKDI